MLNVFSCESAIHLLLKWCTVMHKWKHNAQPLAFKPCVTMAVPCFSWHLKERDKRTQKERRVREQKKRENTHFGSREIREKRWTATLITDPNRSDWDQWNLIESRQGLWQKWTKVLTIREFPNLLSKMLKTTLGWKFSKSKSFGC